MVIADGCSTPARKIRTVEMDEDGCGDAILVREIGGKARDADAVGAQNLCRRIGDDWRPRSLAVSPKVAVVLRKMRATRRPAFVTGRNQHVGRERGDQQQ